MRREKVKKNERKKESLVGEEDKEGEMRDAFF